MSKGRPVVVFLGWCVAAVGVLLAALGGLCTLSMVGAMQSAPGGSQYAMSRQDAWGLALLFGSIPLVSGLFIAVLGLAMVSRRLGRLALGWGLVGAGAATLWVVGVNAPGSFAPALSHGAKVGMDSVNLARAIVVMAGWVALGLLGVFGGLGLLQGALARRSKAPNA